jgi:ATP-dependent helicase/nuclease subunit A
VLAILDDPRLADLFGPDALPEAPIAAVVQGGVVVSGTVDRLLVGADHVTLVDFKTGRAVPPTLEDVPIYHVRQMAAYREALAAIFPERTIAAMLLYTSGPTLFTLPAALLDAHKPGFVPEQQSFDMPG